MRQQHPASEYGERGSEASLHTDKCNYKTCFQENFKGVHTEVVGHFEVSSKIFVSPNGDISMFTFQTEMFGAIHDDMAINYEEVEVLRSCSRKILWRYIVYT